jgi:hypothetical protein
MARTWGRARIPVMTISLSCLTMTATTLEPLPGRPYTWMPTTGVGPHPWPRHLRQSAPGHKYPTAYVKNVTRAHQELGLDLDPRRMRVVLPDFSYRATDSGGIVEVSTTHGGVNNRLPYTWMPTTGVGPHPWPRHLRQSAPGTATTLEPLPGRPSTVNIPLGISPSRVTFLT